MAAQKAAKEAAAQRAAESQKVAAEKAAREAEGIKAPDTIPTAPRDEIVPRESIPRVDIKEPVLASPTKPAAPTFLTEFTPLKRGAEAAAQAAAQAEGYC